MTQPVMLVKLRVKPVAIAGLNRSNQQTSKPRITHQP
jgi:hypothetical protein